jgi:mono/diheme cytochrome c family protein
MLKPAALITIVASLSFAAQAAPLPGSAAEGKKVHEANCLSCHDDSVYKRQDRSVKNFDGLTRQINNCGHAVDSTLGNDKIDDLVKYLNETYYKFK